VSSRSISGLNLSILVIEGSHSDRFGVAIVLLNDLKVQGSFIYGLEAGVGLLHYFLSDRFAYGRMLQCSGLSPQRSYFSNNCGNVLGCIICFAG
jgi:hypothetical protein